MIKRVWQSGELIDLNHLLSTIVSQQEQIQKLYDVMRQVYLDGANCNNAKCADLVRPLHKAMVEFLNLN